MSNAGSILEAVAEYWPALMTGFVGGAGLAYSIASYLAGKPEPGLAYHDGVSPKKIRIFKRIPRENLITRIDNVYVHATSHILGDDIASPTFWLELEHRKPELEHGKNLRFSKGRYFNLARTFLGENPIHNLERSAGEFNEKLKKRLTGERVLLHLMGGEAMAISRIMIPNASQYNSPQ